MLANLALKLLHLIILLALCQCEQEDDPQRSRNYILNRTAIIKPSLWHNKIVYYTFIHPWKYPQTYRSLVEQVTKRIEEVSCLKFQRMESHQDPRPESREAMADPYHHMKNIIEITLDKDETDCFTRASKIGQSIQAYLNPTYCPTKVSILKALMEALGLQHTSLTDIRTIYYDNVQNIARHMDGRKENKRLYELLPLNYKEHHQMLVHCNVMARLNMDLAAKDLLSFRAIRELNAMYCPQCDREQPCYNRGVRNPKDCRKCFCPDGFMGNVCEGPMRHTHPTSDACIGHSRTISTDRVKINIGTPEFPLLGHYPPQDCTWLFTVDKKLKKRRIMFQFVGDKFGYNCTRERLCRDYLEIRASEDLSMDGYRFCCEEFPAKYTITSQADRLLVLSRISHPVSRGFRAKVYLAPANAKPGYVKMG